MNCTNGYCLIMVSVDINFSRIVLSKVILGENQLIRNETKDILSHYKVVMIRR